MDKLNNPDDFSELNPSIKLYFWQSEAQYTHTENLHIELFKSHNFILCYFFKHGFYCVFLYPQMHCFPLPWL